MNTFYGNLSNVAMNTGLRSGELFALELYDIDIKNGFIDANKTLVCQKYLDDDSRTFHVEMPKTSRVAAKCRLTAYAVRTWKRRLD